MAKLIYSAICSLDGYVEDTNGKFDWARPDDEVHAFVNELERPIGTYLYGRRMYETMVFWETVDTGAERSVGRDYAEIWRQAEKIVYSSALDRLASANTRIERAFEPNEVRRMKEAASSDLAIGGATLAGDAMRAGLVDECHLFLVPFATGGGKRALPDGLRAGLELLGERRFGSGVVHLHYRMGR